MIITNTIVLVVLAIVLLGSLAFVSKFLERESKITEEMVPQTAQTTQQESIEETVKQLCIQACMDARSKGQDLSNGPCLLDPVPQYPEWVCDVAHWPRQPIDNLRENQCDAWHAGTAKHFVEVDPNCNFIRSY